MLTQKGGLFLYEQRQKDHFSHYILRLAYCKTTDLQHWFVKQELSLFRLRFLAASPEERDILIKQANLQLDACNLDQLVEIMMAHASKEAMAEGRGKFISSVKAVYGDGQSIFYKVPWEHVFELVAKRQVLIIGGSAFVPESERIVLVLNQFKAHLYKQLNLTAKALPRLDEDDRLMSILFSLAKQSLSKEYQISSSNANEVHAEDVSKLSVHFPPCMQSLHTSLVRDVHLKHNGRIQYGLFLKGIGLNLEEAMIFWRRSFSKLSDDEFNKKGYPYNIRYNYGMEGKRTNYTPYSCLKMIQSLPGPGESHGCPFRHFSNESLGEMMQGLGLDLASANQVVKKAKDGHYQLACTKLFEITRGRIHQAAQVKMEQEKEGEGPPMALDADGNFMLLEPIDHPNKWFDLSFSGKSSRPSRVIQSEDINME
jgi:DNA primase large subunit